MGSPLGASDEQVIFLVSLGGRSLRNTQLVSNDSPSSFILEIQKLQNEKD
jgi:hypothetical protein